MSRQNNYLPINHEERIRAARSWKKGIVGRFIGVKSRVDVPLNQRIRGGEASAFTLHAPTLKREEKIYEDIESFEFLQNKFYASLA